MTLGLNLHVPMDMYLGGAGVSRSDLWTIYTKTPAHYAYGETKKSQAFDFGQAVDLAILSPDEFETKVIRGPADRRGNKWTDAQAQATNSRRLLLTADDYDGALTVRDTVHANMYLNRIITGGVRVTQGSLYWSDEEHGALCKARPDLIRTDLGLILDLKTTRSADPRSFANSVLEYGYHLQESWYTKGYEQCQIGSLNGFVFLAVEKEPPYAFRIYELPPSIVAEGHAVARKAIRIWAECNETGYWPGYEEDVTELPIPAWGYKETPAPKGDE